MTLEHVEVERLLLQVNEEPWNYEEAKELKEWRDACKEEINSITKNNTWELVDLPAGEKSIGLKWIFKIKRNSDGSISRYKARLVAKGYVQRHGIDFDQVFAPVARIETIRLILALAATAGWNVHHLDVKTAFLHGELKEIVYVQQPEGFYKEGEEKKVYKLNKALYGLKQAPRAWNTKLNQILLQLGFNKCSKEASLYRKQEGNSMVIVAVYVDDLLVTGSSLKEIKKFKDEMSKNFEMSDLGTLTYYLGIEVSQGKHGIILKQERYAQKILEEAEMNECNAVHTPMESGSKISKAGEEQGIDDTEYRKIIGCLRYLVHTRPDLSYSVGVLSRYMQEPKVSHGVALKKVLRYLKGTSSYGLFYPRTGENLQNLQHLQQTVTNNTEQKSMEASVTRIVGFCDSSHNIDPDDGRSTTGHVFYLGECPITWCSTKQETVALSSCEAEFMAATEAVKQALWLRDLRGEVLGTAEEKIYLRVDNKSAIALAKNPVFHGRSKHIHTRFHFIRECVESDLVEVEYVQGNMQRADILTKPLGRVKFQEMRHLIGVKDVSKSESEFELKGDSVEVISN